MSLPADEQIAMVQQVLLPLFKNLDVVKAYIAAQSVNNAGDQDNEDDVHTVIDGENNAGNEVPQEEETILNQEDTLLFPLLHTLQGTLEDPLSLSSLRDRVTKSGSRK